MTGSSRCRILTRLAETGRPEIRFRLDGRPATALAGDTVLTAVLTTRRPAARQRIQRRAARRLLPDGRLPGLLGGDRGRASACAPARPPSPRACAWSPERRHERRASSPVDRRRRPGRRARRRDAGRGRPAAGRGRRGRARRRPDLPPPAATASAATPRRSTASRPAKADGAAPDHRRAAPHRLPARRRWSGTSRPGRSTLLHAGRSAQRLPFDALILATGATDRVLPFPGWTLPGVYTLGAAQVALKSQGCAHRPARRLHRHRAAALPGRLAVRQGRRGRSRRCSTPRRSRRQAAPPLPGLLRSPAVAGQGLLLSRPGCGRWRADAARRRPAAAHPGHASGSRALAGATASASSTIDCDAVGFGYGLRSETQLADLAGCRFRFDAAATAPGCRSATPPAAAACPASTSPATAPASPGPMPPSWPASARRWPCCRISAGRSITRPRGQRWSASWPRIGGFRQGLERAFPFPPTGLAQAPDDLVVCRCEEITAGTLRATAVRWRHAGDQPAEGAVPRRHGPLPGPHVRRRGGARSWPPMQRRAASRPSAGCAARRPSSRSRSRSRTRRRQRHDRHRAHRPPTSPSSAAASSAHPRRWRCAASGCRCCCWSAAFAAPQASGVNYGGVRRQGRPLEQMPLSQRAQRIWQRLPETDRHRRRVHPLRPSQARAQRGRPGRAGGLSRPGARPRPRARDRRRQRLPRALALAGRAAPSPAPSCPEDGHANPRLVSPGLRPRRAQAPGARHPRATARATRRSRDGDGFRLLAGDGLEVRSRLAAQLRRRLGRPLRRRASASRCRCESAHPDMAVTEPLPRLHGHQCRASRAAASMPGRSARGNCVMGGGRGIALDDDRARPRPRAIGALLRQAARAASRRCAHAQVIRFWSGVEGDTARPPPGARRRARTTPGLIHAFGFSGAGFQIGPAVGEVLAELVARRPQQPRRSRPSRSAASPRPRRPRRPEPQPVNTGATRLNGRPTSRAAGRRRASLALGARRACAQTKTIYIGMNGGDMEKAYTEHVFPAFEKANGVKVVVVPGTSSDILAKAQASQGQAADARDVPRRRRDGARDRHGPVPEDRARARCWTSSTPPRGSRTTWPPA